LGIGVVTANVPFLTLIFILFTVKHVLADFILQTSWMWRAKDKEHGWISALAAHAGCHAAFTLALALVINPALWWLGVVDFALHATIDRARAVVGRRLSRSICSGVLIATKRMVGRCTASATASASR
jgi:hypothetical protein